MPGRKRGLVYALVLAAVGSHAGPARAWTYQDDTNRFAVDLPADWAALSARELKIRNAIARQQLAGFEPTFAAGFAPAAGKQHARPCLLVQVDPEPTTGKAFGEFEKEYHSYFAAVRKQSPDAVIRMGNRLLFAEPRFDPDRKRFVATLKSFQGRGHELNFECLLQGDLGTRFEFVGKEHKRRPAAGTGYGYFGPDRLVVLYCLETAGNWEKDAAQFKGVVDSFRFHFDAPPPPGPAAGGETPAAAEEPAAAAGQPRSVAAVAAGGCGLGVAGVGFVFWRRRAAAPDRLLVRNGGSSVGTL